MSVSRPSSTAISSPAMSSSLNYGTVDALHPNDADSDAANHMHHRRNADATSLSRDIHSQTFGPSSPVAHRNDAIGECSEQDPFLPSRSRTSSPPTVPTLTTQQPRRKISTFWLLPVVLLAGISRGMTIAPRIEVYTQIACDELHRSPPALNGTFLSSLPSTLRDFTPSPIMVDAPIPHKSSHTSSFLDATVTGDNDAGATAPSKECLQDPAVQSRAAGIQATLATIIGVLGIMTAGYWGQISDAFGRKAALSAVLFGFLFHHVVYILVSIPNSIFNRHAWGFLIVGPIVEGLLGGLTTYQAAVNAFLADCASSGSRSTIFAYYQGFGYVALALGPQIASILLKITGTDARTTMFYTGLTFSIAVFSYVVLILPEPVTPEMMRIARHPIRDADSEGSRDILKTRERWAGRIRELRYRLLAPLTIFGPKRKPGGGWDLNLTLLVIAQLTHLMSVGVVSVKFLYAQHTFKWSVKQLGYYISLLWVLRAFHLLLLLPTVVHFIKPKPPPQAGTGTKRSQALSQDMKFDYRIAQFSIFIDTMAYVLTLIAPASSQILFVCFTSLSSFTAGVNPAIHSLAVSYLFAFNHNANVGQMFGGMSMLQAVSHTLQPLVFGVLYSETVATYPRAIFALAAGLLITSSAIFTLLRTDVTPHVNTEEGLIQQDRDEQVVLDEEHESRGRVESSKPLPASEAVGTASVNN